MLKLVAIEMAASDADDYGYRPSSDEDVYVARPLIEPMLVVGQPEPASYATSSLAALPRVMQEAAPAPLRPPACLPQRGRSRSVRD